MNNFDFWEKIKNLIKERKTTQERIATYTGVSYRTWQSWTYNKSLPDAFQVQRIAEALGVTVEYLVGASMPEGLSESALVIARAADKLSGEGKKAILAAIQGLQRVYPRDLASDIRDESDR